MTTSYEDQDELRITSTTTSYEVRSRSYELHCEAFWLRDLSDSDLIITTITIAQIVRMLLVEIDKC